MTSMNPTKPTTLFADICLGAFAGVAVFITTSLMSVVPKTNNSITVDGIAEYVVEMPESAFKKNLLTVFGAEYNGDSAELNQLLTSYSMMKLEEMEKRKGNSL